MPYVNCLKNGCGGRDAFYIPKGTSPLVWPEESCFGDENLSEGQKKRGIRLSYYPEVYILRRDEKDGKIHLKNISEKTSPLPTQLAGYTNQHYPKVTLYGYMLCLDDKLKDNLSKEDMRDIKHFQKHFQKLADEDVFSSAIHELKHDYNHEKRQEIQAQYGFRLNKGQFNSLCFLDEQTACSAESLHKSQTTNIAEMERIVQTERKAWLNNPHRASYYKEGGDFDVQWDRYLKENAHLPEAPDDKMFQDISKAYLTFLIDGKEFDLSGPPPSSHIPYKKQQSRI